MEKQKRWQQFLIIAVLVVTLYNILPTIIYNIRPLRAPVGQKEATQVVTDIAKRSNSLEKDGLDWLNSFCSVLQIKAEKITFDSQDPSSYRIEFKDKKDAQLFRKFLPSAGVEIPFVPSQLGLMDTKGEEHVVTVNRRLDVHYNQSDLSKLFHFSFKQDNEGKITPFYFQLVQDRFKQIAVNIASNADEGSKLLEEKEEAPFFEFAQKLIFISDSLSKDKAILERYLKGLLQQENSKDLAATRLISKLEDIKNKLETKKAPILEEKKKADLKGEIYSPTQGEYLSYLQNQQKLLERAISILQKERTILGNGVAALSDKEIASSLDASLQKNRDSSSLYTFSFGGRSPLFEALSIDWTNDCLFLKLHKDVQDILSQERNSEQIRMQQEMLKNWMMKEISQVSLATEEKILQDPQGFRVNLYTLPSSRSLVALDLVALGKKNVTELGAFLEKNWKPAHQDLVRERLPIFIQDGFHAAQGAQKKLCVLIAVPTAEDNFLPGLRKGSIYVVVRGIGSIMDQYAQFSESSEAQTFQKDFQQLATLLQRRGFISYPGTTISDAPELSGDFVFELNDFYSIPMTATRESFTVLGSKKYAVLEFSDVEQRLLTLNRIEDRMQEDLLKQKEAYAAAQVDLNPVTRFLVPPPTKNVFLENLKLSASKYVRGDDSRALHWGLDLAGGKSVRISLIDNAGKPVEKMDELRQATNELYQRINKMGVSDRTIRIEGSSILLDFPGSQGLSAQELVKASAMFFHVVNEQFCPWSQNSGRGNKNISKEINEFLQDVWNEAVVTNRQDAESINEIAYKKLEMASKQDAGVGPKSAGKVLYEKGLRLADPKAKRATAAFDDSLSMVACWRADEIKKWSQRNPLVIVFKNYALDGSSLEGISTGYTPSEGNVLYFNVKATNTKEGGVYHPRDDFYAWTSQFSKDGVGGTPREAYSSGGGWGMAVILNDFVISSPSLNAPLREHAMISGHFSQREVSKLASDLKAGSLSFSPKILSETNVSPELGERERDKGIHAAFIGVLLVLAAMIGYYRFAGIVASIAVLINILIIWAVMQNIDATLTLPGLAGIVLTVAMAVDANVLIFERIREEFKISGRLAPSIQAGYRKAFSAILDSNLTTLLAALILLQYDCGPVKGFAMTLIIGISSSMFTALFMTRYFFAGWVQNPAHKELKMREWIKSPNFDFLGWAKPAIMFSIGLFALGSIVFFFQSKAMIGMDFTGGYALVTELETKGAPHMADRVIGAFTQKGVRGQEIQVRELGRPDLVRIQLSTSLEYPGRPFYKMPQELTEGKFTYSWQKNPRLSFIVHTLESAGIQVKPSALPTLEANFSAMSGQLSDTMRNNAIMALLLALVGVLIYIAVRFEWKYAVGAVVALIHDVCLTLAIMAFVNWLGAPVQLNLDTIGAIMTLIGYSLSDTIIIFDRIREDIRLLHKKSFPEIINCALNQTLSRTLMTSGTTLLVLFSLDFFAGSTIFGFAFVMTCGVFLGTLSSLFIASPVLLWLHNREEAERLAVQS